MGSIGKIRQEAIIVEGNILFQKFGSIWYVFCQLKDELLYASLPLGVNPRQDKVKLFEVIHKISKKKRWAPLRRDGRTSL